VRSTFRVYYDLDFASGVFVLTPRVLLHFPDQTSLILRLANNGPSKARLRHAYLRARPRVLMRSVNGFVRGPGHVAAGETGMFDLAWRVPQRRVPTPLEFEFVVASAPSEPLHLAFKLPGIERNVEERAY
jgi:hypothetical protein